ncbi:hypothetical protein V6N13_049347 [Hibiscus sabdariffa]|uniref:Uncharacterized protein n=1 Tax=Hibiscus sabdariffa TaxID=183260 RepID=A0ABR2QY74_9ROSI
MSEKLSLLSCFSFQALGPWHGSFSHGSPTPPASLAGLQNYLRSCSEVISVVWLFPVERSRRSSRAFEVVKVVGWKRVYVGRRIVLRSGKFCLGAVTEKGFQPSLYEAYENDLVSTTTSKAELLQDQL